MTDARTTQLIAAAILAAAVCVAVWLVPRALASLGIPVVQRVELSGARYLLPQAVVELAAIDESASVFGDRRVWRDRLVAHPLIEEASVRRRLPSTLVIRIREVDPIGLAALPELRPVDEEGRLLPLEPAGLAMDLPILHGDPVASDDADAADSPTMALAALLARMRRSDADLVARVSEARPGPGTAARLVLRDPRGAEAWLEADAGALEFARLAATLADLDERGDARRRPRLDLRYRDQVVVSFDPRTD